MKLTGNYEAETEWSSPLTLINVNQNILGPAEKTNGAANPVCDGSPEQEDPFLRNIVIARNEAVHGFDYRLSYDDGHVSTHVDFTVTDAELAAASNAEVLIAERRGDAREKLKNAVICLKRLLPPEPAPVRRTNTVSSSGTWQFTTVSSFSLPRTHTQGGQKITP